jgi:hypothetical protein
MKLSFSRRRRPARPATRRAARLDLEALEDRSLPSSSPALPTGYGQLPLAFQANQGQAPATVNYVAQGGGYSVDLTAQQAVVALSPADPAAGTTLTMKLLGANPSAPPTASDGLVTRVNYLIGSDPGQWHTNVPTYGQVTYQNVYQGVDAVYAGNQGQLETSFVVHPGANPAAIQMQVQGTEGLALDAQGNLVIHLPGGDVTELAPVAYQDMGGVRQAVSSRYVLEGGNAVGFQLGAYDPTQALVIDPTLSYSSYLPGPGVAIAVDSSGDAYVTGYTTGYNDTGSIGYGGPFVDKLNPAGTALIYQTFLSTSGGGTGIAVDGQGDAYVTGNAGSDLATTSNALSRTYPSGYPAFLAVLGPSGSGLLYSTWLPGLSRGAIYWGSWVVSPSLAIAPAGDDPLDNVYLTGEARAAFLTTPNAYQPNFEGSSSKGVDAFLAQIDPNRSGMASLLYDSFLGPGQDAGTGIAVDGSGNAYVVGRTDSTNFPTTAGAFQGSFGGGEDVFVAKFNPSASGSASLVYSTYLGGSGVDGFYPWDVPMEYITNNQPGPGIAVDSAGNAYVAGITDSTNFPTTPGAFQTTYGGPSSGLLGDAFVTKLNPTGTGLVYSTYLGGSGQDGATSIAVDAAGDAYVTGMTRSTNFPTKNPIQSKDAGGSDAFVTTLNPSGSALLFSTYLGGAAEDYAYSLALDSANNVYVTGQTYSTNYPTTAGAYDTTLGGGFVFKITAPVTPGAAAPATGTTTAPATAAALFLSAGGGLPLASAAPGNGATALAVATTVAAQPSAAGQGTDPSLLPSGGTGQTTSRDDTWLASLTEAASKGS